MVKRSLLAAAVSIQGFPASLQPVSWGFPALEEDFHKSGQEQRTGGVCRGKNREQPPGQLARAMEASPETWNGLELWQKKVFRLELK